MATEKYLFREGEGRGGGREREGGGKGDKFFIYSRHVYRPSTVPVPVSTTVYFLFRLQAVSMKHKVLK
jgi:hypothetical protein